MSNKFHKVKVQDIYKTTKDCSIVTLDIPSQLRSDFNFKQGQYLTLKATINGEDVRRSYSLCSSPNDEMWQVGIKKIVDGKFSSFANDHLAVGDEIEVMAPAGNFYVDVDDSKATNYVAFAAGSGITPIYSIGRKTVAKYLAWTRYRRELIKRQSPRRPQSLSLQHLTGRRRRHARCSPSLQVREGLHLRAIHYLVRRVSNGVLALLGPLQKVLRLAQHIELMRARLTLVLVVLHSMSPTMWQRLCIPILICISGVCKC